MINDRTFRGGKLRKEALITFLILSIFVTFYLIEESQYDFSSIIEHTPVEKNNVFITLLIELNGETTNNLTAVFYFNDTNTFDTDNSTLNQEFLDYFIQRLETIRNQVSGIKAFPLGKLGIKFKAIFPIFENSSNFDANFEQTNKSAILLREEWYILTAEAGLLIVYYAPEDPLYIKIIKNPEIPLTIFASFLLILVLYLKKLKPDKQQNPKKNQ